MKAKIVRSDGKRGGLQKEKAMKALLQIACNYGVDSCNHDDFFERLRMVVDAFAIALDEAAESVSFQYAAELSMVARAHRRPSTRADLRSYLRRICSHPSFSDTPLRHIKIVHCRQMLQCCFGHSPHAYRKAQSMLHSVFSFGIRQGWCSTNPAKAILRPPVREKRIELLTLQQIKALVTACQQPNLQSMDAPLRLMLWCGIRPMEVRRLHWGDIDPEECVVYVEGQHSKTGGARAVPLRGGAVILKERCLRENAAIAPANWERLWQRVRKAAGFAVWQNDVLRHTFASMHLKCFHCLPLLQEEMGHRNASLLQTRYLNLRGVKKNVAKRFFRDDMW